MTPNIITGLYADDLQLTVDQQGEGRPLVLLHGGGEPPSMGLLPSAFHDPAAAPDPTQLPQAARDIQAANAATLAVYAREPYMHDPKLLRRLALVPTPVVAVWGESDQIGPEAYGRAYSASFPNGRFEPIPEAGHLPHLEQPERVLDAIHRFAGETTRSATT